MLDNPSRKLSSNCIGEATLDPLVKRCWIISIHVLQPFTFTQDKPINQPFGVIILYSHFLWLMHTFLSAETTQEACWKDWPAELGDWWHFYPVEVRWHTKWSCCELGWCWSCCIRNISIFLVYQVSWGHRVYGNIPSSVLMFLVFATIWYPKMRKHYVILYAASVFYWHGTLLKLIFVLQFS